MWPVADSFFIFSSFLILLTFPGSTVRAVVKHSEYEDLHLYIAGDQIKKFGGYNLDHISIIDDGQVQADIMNPYFENYLPIIPSEVSQINFTWMSGKKKYYYHFNIRTLDETILNKPTISIHEEGKIPKKPKVFSVMLPCSRNRSGVAFFEVGLDIWRGRRNGKSLMGTPIRLKLRKECAPSGSFSAGPDPECDKSCAHGGRCNSDRVCVCTEGYMGQYCKTALCYPQCMNGTCTAPGVCTCLPGYFGRHCEGGYCRDQCQNGGKCVGKDVCVCTRGFYGKKCEFSKCLIPCQNGGKCKGPNVCRCPLGFQGDHCEVATHNLPQRSTCPRPCKHGICQSNRKCLCEPGWTGKSCQHRRSTHSRWMDHT